MSHLKRSKRFIANRYVVLIMAAMFVVPAIAQPKPEHGLHYTEPAMVWDEAFPLGNGLMGALVWGDGEPLNISLDRTDLWDLRPVPEFTSKYYSYKTMREWVKEGRIDALHKLYDDPYHNPGPTKIPAGRIQLTIPNAGKFSLGALDLAEAVANVKLGEDTKVKVFVSAEMPIGIIEVESKEAPQINLLEPPFSGQKGKDVTAADMGWGELATLKYDAPKKYSGKDEVGFERQCTLGVLRSTLRSIASLGRRGGLVGQPVALLLHQVEVQASAVGMASIGHTFEFGHDAGLVVGQQQRHQRTAFVDGLDESFPIQPALFVYGDDTPLDRVVRNQQLSVVADQSEPSREAHELLEYGGLA